MKIADYLSLIRSARNVVEVSPRCFGIFVCSDEWPDFRVELSDDVQQGRAFAEFFGCYGHHVFNVKLDSAVTMLHALRAIKCGAQVSDETLEENNLGRRAESHPGRNTPSQARKRKGKKISIPAKTYTFNGKTLKLSQWSQELGISDDTLRKRLRKGWSVERAFTTQTVGSLSLHAKQKTTSTAKEHA